ncbi:MAG: DMT family transporter [Phycisphaerales bacterium]|nr:DMT family transporter [Phycisphaerales bacterium]MCB9836421.1 DMT family transporter [Phycisphaera sp.]
MTIAPETVGVIAGLTTSAFWVLTTIFFTAGGKRIGVTAVNTLRMFFAIILLGATHLILFKTVVPQIPSTMQWGALALSGFIGLTICDQALFAAFLDIGPRRALLVMTSTPIFALTFGYLILKESIGLVALAGIGITIMGIAWVVLQRQSKGNKERHPHLIRGYTLAVVGSVCQSLGAMFAKIGMGSGETSVDPLAATLVRMIFGLLCMTPIVLISYRMVKKREPGSSKLRWTPGILFTLAGAIFGPFLGVWLSLVAIRSVPLGVAQTLLSLSPVMILPFVGKLYKEKLTWAAILGAVIAVGGAGVISMAGSIEKYLGITERSSDENTGNAAGHPACERPAQHGARPDAGEV